MYQALYRKWRPRTFDDVVGQEHITETLKRQVAAGRLSHAYLFTGTRGTGKTTCAKILARAVNCRHPAGGNPCNQCAACTGIENGSILDVLELDAASNNGVDHVRALRDEAIYTPAAVQKRVYIIDEVHMLSTAAFNALLKILEEPPEHLLFILATTELHKVPATIKSRCQQFSFKRILPTEITARLSYVAAQENIDLSPSAASLLARLADGGLRDALSLLDQCAAYAARVDEPQVLEALGLAGNVEIAALMNLIARGDTAGALEALARLYAAGKEVRALLGELSSLTRDLLIRKTAPQGGAALLTGGYDESTLRSLSETLQPARLMQMLTLLQAAAADLGRSIDPRTDAELCLIRLCNQQLDGSPAGLAARLERLEQQLAQGISSPPAGTPTPAEDTPPWDAEPPQDPEPLPAASPAQPPVPAAQPSDDAAPPLPADSAFWSAIAMELLGHVPMGEYTLLSDPSMTTGVYHDGVLELWVDSDFVRLRLDRSAVLEPVAKAAGARAGREVRVSVKVGTPPAVPPPAPPAEHDDLEDLLALGRQFDNIDIKE